MAEKPLVVALKYDKALDEAPRVVARGEGAWAEKILELARLHHIPIRQDKALVVALSKIKLNQEIPPQLYHAVAMLLNHLYRLNDRHRLVQKVESTTTITNSPE